VPSPLDAEAILAEYRQPPVSIQRQTKLGCLLYFGVALALLVLFVTGIYLYFRRAHGR
jgi:uncharacterized membrane protein YhaH (DUF805 family)